MRPNSVYLTETIYRVTLFFASIDIEGPFLEKAQ